MPTLSNQAAARLPGLSCAQLWHPPESRSNCWARIPRTPPLPGDTVYVCIRAVPPYVLPRDYNTIGPNGGPATLDFLRNVTLDGANLDGFDTRYLNYIFSVVGITPVYLPTESEAGARCPRRLAASVHRQLSESSSTVGRRSELPVPLLAGLYRALLNRSCDMAVSSISLDPKRNSCNATCPWCALASPFLPGASAEQNTSRPRLFSAA